MRSIFNGPKHSKMFKPFFKTVLTMGKRKKKNQSKLHHGTSII